MVKKSQAKTRVVVYTAIAGGHDILLNSEVANPEYDYICFTDRKLTPVAPWKFWPMDYFSNEVSRMNQYYQLHPHFYLKGYDIALWIDFRIRIKNDLSSLIEEFVQGQNPLAMFMVHPKNSFFLRIRKSREHGLKGSPNPMIVISRPNNQDAQKIFNCWWAAKENGSSNDPSAAMYALSENRSDYTRLGDTFSFSNKFEWKKIKRLDRWRQSLRLLFTVYNSPFFIKNKQDREYYPWWKDKEKFGVTDTDLWPFRGISIDIIIPIHNALNDVKRCLRSVEPTLLQNHRLIIIDDGSAKETRCFLRDFEASRQSFVTLICHEDSLGYTKAANIGLKASTSEYVILLNSDTIVPDRWSLKLIQCAASAEEIGIVGPLSNAASWQSVPRIKEKDGGYSLNPLPAAVTVNDMDRICEDLYLPVFPRVGLVNGFCFCIKRTVIKEIGYFDDISYPKGYGEEDDFCFRATNAGFSLAIATHTYVYHAKSKSYTPERRLKLCKKSLKILLNKYGAERIKQCTDSLRNNPFINKIRFGIIERRIFSV